MTVGLRLTKQATQPVMLTPDQQHVIASALPIAAAKYRENAKIAREAGPQYAGIADQFDQQAIDVDRTYAAILDHDPDGGR
jgi:hypothetical protein